MRSFDVVNVEPREAASGGSSGGEAGLSTTEVLDRRCASGELTREEYLTIRGDIMRNKDA